MKRHLFTRLACCAIFSLVASHATAELEPQIKKTIWGAEIVEGCLLPFNELNAKPGAGSAKAIVQIAKNSSPVAAQVLKSAGDPDLDQAFLRALRSCRYVVTDLMPADQYATVTIDQAWDTTTPLEGERRCMRPRYPGPAARNEEQGTVTVKFTMTGSDGTFEGTVINTSKSISLRSTTIRHLQNCLRHSEVHQSYPKGTSHSLDFKWALD